MNLEHWGLLGLALVGCIMILLMELLIDGFIYRKNLNEFGEKRKRGLDDSPLLKGTHRKEE